MTQGAVDPKTLKQHLEYFEINLDDGFTSVEGVPGLSVHSAVAAPSGRASRATSRLKPSRLLTLSPGSGKVCIQVYGEWEGGL